VRKWIAIVVGGLAAVVAGGVAVFYMVFPNVSEAESIRVERSTERVVRGQYLANHVMICVDCHSEREVDLYSMPPIRSLEFGGGFAYTREMGMPGTIVSRNIARLELGAQLRMGMPGTIVSRNITPGALRDWSDGEIVRAIAAGVSRDGRPLFPLMPYHAYGKLDREDINAVVAYLRVIPPVNRPIPDSKVDFPVNLVMRTLPRDPAFRTKPHPRNPVAYGGYLVAAAGCGDCHTRRDERGNAIGPEFAGGQEFAYPARFLVRSANITPDAETGIGAWGKDAFIARFKGRTETDYRQMAVARGQPNTVMPWWAYSGMTAEDLGAIYEYLRTVPAAKNQVQTFEPR
jgi:mono/diheme cytochrome c family protein